MEKILELLNGVDVYGLPVGGQVPYHIKDNVQTSYLYLQAHLLAEILKEIRELKALKEEKTVEAKTETKAKTSKPTSTKE